MSTKKLLKLFVLLLIPVFISITSCDSDDPITPNHNFSVDSSRFNWECTRVPFNDGFWYGLWAADTNDIFAGNNYFSCLIRIYNGNISYFYNTSTLIYTYIDGISPSEGYAVCLEKKDNKWLPLIKRWTGTEFADLPSTYTYKKGFAPTSFLLKSSTEMWIGQVGIVHKFDGINISQTFLPDSTFAPIRIFYDSDGILSCLCRKYIDTLLISMRVSKYDGDKWEDIYEDINPNYGRAYDVTGNNVVAYDYPKNIYILEGSSLKLVLTLPDELILYLPFAGKITNDLFAVGGIKGNNGPTLLNWNGQKWSDEGKNIEMFYPFYDLATLKMINNNFYCGFVMHPVHPFLIRGFRKNLN